MQASMYVHTRKILGKVKGVELKGVESIMKIVPLVAKVRQTNIG